MRSRTTSSGRSSRAFLKPSSPSLAAITSNPSISSPMRSTETRSASSSTMRILVLLEGMAPLMEGSPLVASVSGAGRAGWRGISRGPGSSLPRGVRQPDELGFRPRLAGAEQVAHRDLDLVQAGRQRLDGHADELAPHLAALLLGAGRRDGR